MNELRIYERTGEQGGAEQTYIYWDRVRKFMEFIGMSLATLSRKSGTPESTLRKLLQGVTKDPRVSTIQPIFKALELDANIALGLSPPRDYGEETARENVPLTEALQRQLDDVRAERDAQMKELDRLRKLVLDKGEKLSRMEERAADAEQLSARCADQQQRLEYKAEKIQSQAEEIARLKATIEARDKTVENLETLARRNRKSENWNLIFAVAMVAAFVALAAFYIWDISNLNKGPTSWMYPDMFQ